MKTVIQKYILYLLTISTIVVLPGCDSFVGTHTPQNKKTLHIINVNDRVLYDDAHIKGDSNIAFEDFENLETHTKGWNKASSIVVYCTDYACTASKVVAKEFSKLGFTDVYVYTGGAAEWHKLSKQLPDYQMVGPQKQQYLNQLNEKIETTDPDIRVITAHELLKKIQEEK